jgi:hypothetical protein
VRDARGILLLLAQEVQIRAFRGPADLLVALALSRVKRNASASEPPRLPMA